jgi:hypothetical protein
MLRRLRMDDNLIVFRTNLDAADLRIANIKHFAPIRGSDRHGAERVLMALNLGADPTAVDFGSPKIRGRILISSFADRDGEPLVGSVDLRGDEGLTIEPEADVPLPSDVA